jgi:hypothetical protein
LSLDGKNWITLVTSNSVVLDPQSKKFATVYPNPNNGAFKLKVESSITDDLSYSFMDATGKELEKGVKQNVQIESPAFDFSKYPLGVYNLSLSAGNKQNVMRVILR